MKVYTLFVFAIFGVIFQINVINCNQASFVTVTLRGLNDADKREEMSVLPDQLAITLKDKGKDIHLNLERSTGVNYKDLQVFVVDDEQRREWTQGDQSKEEVGYYHDSENDAIMTVRIKSRNLQVSGTFVHESRAMELTPLELSEDYRQLRDLFENDNVHVMQRSSFEYQSMSDDFVSMLKTDIKLPLTKKRRQSSDRRDRPTGEYSPPPTDHNASPEDGQTGAKDTVRARLMDILREMSVEKRDRTKREEVVTNAKRDIPLNIRTNTQYNVQLTFFIDDSVYAYFLNLTGSSSAAITEITYYYVHIFNGMNMAFRRMSEYNTGISITIWLQEITIYSTISSTNAYVNGPYPANSNSVLNPWNVGQNIGNWSIGTTGYKWYNKDVIMYWTKRPMQYQSVLLAGIAPTCGVCSMWAWTVCRDQGLFSWTTGAHELAHNLGASHDDVTTNGCPTTNKFLLSTTPLSLATATLSNSFRFSPCTVNSIAACLTGRSDGYPKVCTAEPVCTNTQPLTGITQLPGQRYSLNQQCLMAFGPGAVFNSACVTSLPDICMNLTCYQGGVCKTGNPELRAAEGTQCNSVGPLYCLAGTCRSLTGYQYSVTSGTCGTVPTPSVTGCSDAWTNCQSWVDLMPSNFFTNYNVRLGCLKTAKQYGLYVSFNDPCVCPSLYAFQCPVNGVPTCQGYDFFCDGYNDCDNAVDESATYCRPHSLELPICNNAVNYLVYLHVANTTLQTFSCVPNTEACNGVQAIRRAGATVDKGDEDTAWCGMLPKAACGVGYTNSATNPTLCVATSG